MLAISSWDYLNLKNRMRPTYFIFKWLSEMKGRRGIEVEHRRIDSLRGSVEEISGLKGRG
ncbi:MAG: hypothetical protein ACPLPS_04185 [bacterium]